MGVRKPVEASKTWAWRSAVGMLEDRRKIEWNFEGPDLLIVVIMAVDAIVGKFRHLYASFALSLAQSTVLVSLHRRVYLFCPGLDPSLQVLNLLEAETL